MSHVWNLSPLSEATQCSKLSSGMAIRDESTFDSSLALNDTKIDTYLPFFIQGIQSNTDGCRKSFTLDKSYVRKSTFMLFMFQYDKSFHML